MYLAFFIFDNTIIYMTEFLNSFAQSYDQAFMSAPAVKTIIFMGNAFSPFLFLPNYTKKNSLPPLYAIDRFGHLDDYDPTDGKLSI